MIDVRSIICNPFQERCYVLWDETKAAAVIDCGCSSLAEQKRLQDIVTRHDLHVVAHYATHAHLDHLFGAAWLYRTYGVKTYLHPADMPLAERLRQQTYAFGFPWDDWEFPIAAYEAPFLPANAVPLSPNCFAKGKGVDPIIIPSPGHSPGSVCLYYPDEEQPILFSGDTLFRDGFGRTDLWGGDYSLLMSSLQRLTKDLPKNTKVFPGHGETTYINENEDENEE